MSFSLNLQWSLGRKQVHLCWEGKSQMKISLDACCSLFPQLWSGITSIRVPTIFLSSHRELHLILSAGWESYYVQDQWTNLQEEVISGDILAFEHLSFKVSSCILKENIPVALNLTLMAAQLYILPNYKRKKILQVVCHAVFWYSFLSSCCSSTHAQHKCMLSANIHGSWTCWLNYFSSLKYCASY